MEFHLNGFEDKFEDDWLSITEATLKKYPYAYLVQELSGVLLLVTSSYEPESVLDFFYITQGSITLGRPCIYNPDWHQTLINLHKEAWHLDKHGILVRGLGAGMASKEINREVDKEDINNYYGA